MQNVSREKDRVPPSLEMIGPTDLMQLEGQAEGPLLGKALMLPLSRAAWACLMMRGSRGTSTVRARTKTAATNACIMSSECAGKLNKSFRKYRARSKKARLNTLGL